MRLLARGYCRQYQYGNQTGKFQRLIPWVSIWYKSEMISRFTHCNSGWFKSQQCQQLLTGPSYSQGPHKKQTNKKKKEREREKKRKNCASNYCRSKGPSGITGGVAEDFFAFHFFKPLKFICFGSTRMDISTGKKAFHAGKKCHWRVTTVNCWQGPFL